MHRAPASTKSTGDDVAKRDAVRWEHVWLAPTHPPPQAGEGSKRPAPDIGSKGFAGERFGRFATFCPLSRLRGRGRVGALQRHRPWLTPHPNPPPQGGREYKKQAGGSGGASGKQGFSEFPQREFAPANYGTAATIPTLDPELAKQLGFTTEEEDAAAMARPPRNKMEALGVAATADALENLIREGRPEFKGEDGQVKIWTPHRPPRPEKSEGGEPFVINPNMSRRATSPPRSPTWSRASSATTAPRCCSASPEAARPTPWPR